MSDLERLARPFPPQYVEKAPGGKFGSYVPHPIVNQALLAIVGPFNWSVTDWQRGEDGKIEGCVGRLSCTIDGVYVEVCEPGDCEQPSNWKTQGARMKDAASDAFKRCCMRMGLGLHLWSKDHYFLYDQLSKRTEQDAGGEVSLHANEARAAAGSPPAPAP
jgi:hypothetical protein